MGVKYTKEYNHIIDELMNAVKYVERFYTFFGMDDLDWKKLSKEEQEECLRTMSHDIIYGLGGDPNMEVGRGSISYEEEQWQIRVSDGQKCIHVIRLK